MPFDRIGGRKNSSCPANENRIDEASGLCGFSCFRAMRRNLFIPGNREKRGGNAFFLPDQLAEKTFRSKRFPKNPNARREQLTAKITGR